MDVQHVASLKAAAGSRIPVAVGLFQGGLVAATPGSPNFECDVCVWQLSGVRVKLTQIILLQKQPLFFKLMYPTTGAYHGRNFAHSYVFVFPSMGI